MPLSGISRLATFLVDRNDKANEDVAVLLDQLADLSDRIADKWVVNLNNVERLHFEGERIKDGRSNQDVFEQLFSRGVSVRDFANARRSNNADVFEASELLRSMPDDVFQKFQRVAERFSVDGDGSTKKKGQNGNAYVEAKKSIESLLRTRSQLRRIFDEVFDDLERQSGPEILEKLEGIDFYELEKKVERIQKQSAKVKAISRYYRTRIR